VPFFAPLDQDIPGRPSVRAYLGLDVKDISQQQKRFVDTFDLPKIGRPVEEEHCLVGCFEGGLLKPSAALKEKRRPDLFMHYPPHRYRLRDLLPSVTESGGPVMRPRRPGLTKTRWLSVPSSLASLL
jgi:hypothetical protein